MPAIPGPGTPGWLARALSLAERSAAARPNTAVRQDAGERLARWQAGPPFPDGPWWAARLAAAGLDDAGLLALLGEADGELADRVPEPWWTSELAVLTGDPVPAASLAGPEIPFATAVAPLLAAGRERLLARLAELAVKAGEPGFDPELLAGQLYAPLPAALNAIVFRALVLELNLARLAGQLTAAHPRARFAQFADGLSDPGRRRALLARYPVLARQLATEADAWLAGSLRLAAHLAADQAAIGAACCDGGSPGTVTQVVTGLGDRHRGGATVSLVTWSSGLRLVYKPRPMSMDAHFQELLTWINGRGLDPPLRTATCLDRGDHGWMEYVTARPCAGPGQLARFYQRQGSLLALLYLLGATDFHSENLIAAGEDPVLVDLETLVLPRLPADESGQTAAERAAAEAARGSVLPVGLLPQRAFVDSGDSAIDISGLGHSPGQRTPLALPTIRDPGTDTMRLELAHGQLGLPAHRPVQAGVPLRLLDYAGEVLDGFTRAYELLASHRAELAAGCVAAFAGDEARVILRPTVWYATILQTSFHPDVLGDGLDRERHYDALWRDVPQFPAMAACTEHERADLWRNDIPLFTARTDEAVLRDSEGALVAGFALEPGLDRVLARLAGLGEADLERQRWLVTGALGTSAISGPDSDAALYQHAVSPRPAAGPASQATGPELIAGAEAIAARLAAIAFRADDSAQWLGINALRGQSWSLGPLQADLFHGLLGVALFLAQLGALTGDRAQAGLAADALRTARGQLDRTQMHQIGGMAGAGGVVYGYCELARLLEDESLLDAAADYAERAAPHLDADTRNDFATGSAGTLAGLLRLHELRPSGAVRDQIAAAAGRLLATAVHGQAGTGWVSGLLRETGRAGDPVAGFAHGVGGIVTPLLEAAAALGDERCDEAGRAGLRYEQALFDPAAGTWRELRAGSVAEPIDERAYWCYGAMGIGLSRLLSLPLAGQDPVSAREIGAALATVAAQGPAAHCLCHGDLGNLELYLQAARVLGEPRWAAAARQRAGAILADIGQSGWICGTPLGVEVPGLLTGLAGIGYGLLRVAEPAQVPAVLALRPPEGTAARARPSSGVKVR
ncbi:MAG TPA: type 2 lanthipeptide synthetase LanM family protein [Streptosporangiaceae bacterium]|jgi:type 2 lantibiotic biosynthesis protein LanM